MEHDAAVAALAPSVAAVTAALARVVTEASPSRAAPVVLIDGPSGAGKSTFADALVAAWPGDAAPTLVHMDDVYPGWDGLAAGAREVHELLLLPRSEGRPAGWRRYDWSIEAPRDWVPVDASCPLIVEGCGTLLAANVPLSDVRVWITADDAVRKRRALARDHGAFDAHWDRWQRQFEEFVAAEHPADGATVLLDGTGVAKPGAETTVGP